ncbi:MAG: hypothetical protein H0U72_08035 [Nitrosospira sp.]|nr:hypothetical protein [Nitrosospira sp.]
MLNKVIALAICNLALLSGCASLSPAEQYAQNLSKVLKAYQDQTNQKVRAEQAAYRRLASIYSRAQDEDVTENLYLERSERAEQIADKLLQQGIKQSTSRSKIRHWLQNYGAFDFSQTQPLLERESDARTKFVTNLENLEVESKLIKSLVQSLEDLASPQSQADRLKAELAFAEKAGAEFKRLECNDIKNTNKTLQAQLKKETDTLKQEQIQNQITLKARQCPE